MPAVTHDPTDHLHHDLDPTDAALAAERRYLAAARSDLTRMRERTLSLSAHGGDRVAAG